MILVLGTPNSGKSSLAESIAEKIGAERPMAYVATMIPFGEEGQNRIQRHRRLREGKNFVTFEEPYSLTGLGDWLREKNIDTALLECVSNLVGNVAHKPENLSRPEDELIEDIVCDIERFSKQLKNLVVVANNFDFDSQYDNDTRRYISINNAVNERLKLLSKAYYVKEGEEWIRHDNN